MAAAGQRPPASVYAAPDVITRYKQEIQPDCRHERHTFS